MTSFERPLILSLLLLPLLLALLRLFKGGTRISAGLEGPERSFALGRAPALDRGPLAPLLGRSRLLWAASSLLFWAGFSLVAIASAGPRSLRTERVFLDRGKDIVFVLDVSPSMAARDMPALARAREAEEGAGDEPLRGRVSRLEACLGLVRDFAGAGGNASLGLVVFGSEALLLLPPTEDRDALLERLDGLSPGMEGEGTALGMGILTALSHLRSSRAPARSAIVFTDGESNAGEVSPERAAELCRRSGLELSIVAVGRKGEAPLSWKDPETGKAWEGSYLSDFDPSSLEETARMAGGSFVLAEDEGSLQRLRASFLRSAGLSGRFREGLFSRSLVFPFLAAGLSLLLLAWLLSTPLLEAPRWP